MTTAQILVRADEPSFFTRVRLRAHRRVLRMREQWDGEGAGGGLVIPDREVDRILLGTRQEEADEADDDGATWLTTAIGNAEVRFDADERWRALRERLGVTGEEIDLLTLCAAVDFDPWMRRVCGYLHDDATISGATVWLAAQLFGWPGVSAFGSGSALLRWKLAAPADSPMAWGPGSVWTADPQLSSWLCGAAATPWQRLDGVRVVASVDAAAELLHEAELGRALHFIESIRASSPGTSIELQLSGAPGSGRRTFAAQLCAALGRPAVIADLSQPDEALRAVRAARLIGAGVCVHGGNDAAPKSWQAVRGGCDLLIVAGDEAAPRSDAARLSLSLGPLERSARHSFWTRLTGTEPPPSVAEWSLTAEEIVAAAHVAPAGNDAVAASCARVLDRELPELLQRLPLPWTWDDIVLPRSVREGLVDFENQIRYRGEVLDGWGFQRLVPFGRGLTAMFAGPSGTGKTMAAQVLARSRGLPLYRVDLAGVVNKYIGETEKRLKRVFDACERTEAILFFDEADALFGQRTQVRDAHDRFANIEIDYLLQRMEQFDGVAILATNRKGDLDSAFLRRLRVVVEFAPPARDERLALWRLALPELAPHGERLLDGIEWEYLAEKLALTGAEIKSAALAAAYRARAQESRIGMRQVISAARRELAKRGAVLRAPEWEGPP